MGAFARESRALMKLKFFCKKILENGGNTWIIRTCLQ